MTLSPEVLESARTLHVERGGDLTWNQIVDYMGLNVTAEALRKRVSRYEKRSDFDRNSFLQSPIGTVTTVSSHGISVHGDSAIIKNLIDRINYLEEKLNGVKPTRIVSNPDDGLYPAPVVEEYPAHLHDTERWEQLRSQLIAKHEMLRVVVLTDIHIPDHSITAMNLALKIIKHVQPHVIIFGGDIFDFDIMSTFQTDLRRIRRDAIKEVRNIWNNIVDACSKIVPDATLVAFKGNHDDRFDRWNKTVQNPIFETTEEIFVEMIRSKDRVLWLGEYQETHIGGMIVQHGKRAGENAAKMAAKDWGWGTSQVQGHNHRPGVYIHRINNPRDRDNYRVVMSVSSGALCNIPPHYQQDTRQSAWLNGMVVSHVATKTDDVHINNLVFHKKPNGALWTAYGNEFFEAQQKKRAN